MSADKRASNRGFASMDGEKQRRIASKGGRSVPNEKRSFSLDRRLAAEAGRKGGQASRASARKRAGTTTSGADSR
ncbi:MAG: KGG domain-containing protein [Steroidobacteraceae bacterium]